MLRTDFPIARNHYTISPPPIASTRRQLSEKHIQQYTQLSLSSLEQINSDTNNNQINPCIKGDLMTWASNHLDARYFQIIYRAFNQTDNQLTDAFSIDPPLYGSYLHPRAVAASDSTYMIGFDDTSDVFYTDVTIKDYQSSPVQQLNDFESSTQENIALASSDEGFIASAWGSRTQDGNGKGIVGKNILFNDTMTSEEIINSETYGTQQKPDVTVLSTGDVGYVWTCQDDNLFGVCGKITTKNFSTVVPEFQINSNDEGSQQLSRIVALKDHFVVSWVTVDTISTVNVKVFDNYGTETTLKIRVDDMYIDTTSRPALAPLADGTGFTIVYGTHEPDGYHAYFQIFDNACNEIYSKTELTNGPQSTSTEPDVSVTKEGIIQALFKSDDADGSGIFLRALTPMQSAPPSHLPSSAPSSAPSISPPPTVARTDYPSSPPSVAPFLSAPPTSDSTPALTTIHPNGSNSSDGSIQTILIVIVVGLVVTLGLSLLYCLCGKGKDSEQNQRDSSSQQYEMSPRKDIEYRDPTNTTNKTEYPEATAPPAPEGMFGYSGHQQGEPITLQAYIMEDTNNDTESRPYQVVTAKPVEENL